MIAARVAHDRGGGEPPSDGPAPLLEVARVGRTFPVGGTFSRRVLRALHDVSFSVARGEAVALVGESGSGKSTLARLLVGLDLPSDGVVRLGGRALPRRPTLAQRRRVQMVFQDPFASLNPVHTVGHHLERPLSLHHRERDVASLLEAVGLSAQLADVLPDTLSGGQRQRVALARALAPEPDLLVADEPTSMLDVSMRAEILGMFARERRQRGLTLVLVTHDLAAARAASDRLLVLYAGLLVEEGPTEDVLATPAHPYTRLLLAAARSGQVRAPLPARPGRPVVIDPPPGCPFAARCPSVEARCQVELPLPVEVAFGRVARCHLLEGGRT